MAGQPNIQARLREGIEAAKNGDRITARRNLQQVLSYERNNEIALMWMASVVDSVEERRSFLRRVLEVNPTNQRAIDALARLGGAPIPLSNQRQPARRPAPVRPHLSTSMSQYEKPASTSTWSR